MNLLVLNCNNVNTVRKRNMFCSNTAIFLVIFGLFISIVTSSYALENGQTSAIRNLKEDKDINNESFNFQVVVENNSTPAPITTTTNSCATTPEVYSLMHCDNPGDPQYVIDCNPTTCSWVVEMLIPQEKPGFCSYVTNISPDPIDGSVPDILKPCLLWEQFFGTDAPTTNAPVTAAPIVTKTQTSAPMTMAPTIAKTDTPTKAPVTPVVYTTEFEPLVINLFILSPKSDVSDAFTKGDSLPILEQITSDHITKHLRRVIDDDNLVQSTTANLEIVSIVAPFKNATVITTMTMTGNVQFHEDFGQPRDNVVQNMVKAAFEGQAVQTYIEQVKVSSNDNILEDTYNTYLGLPSDFLSTTTITSTVTPIEQDKERTEGDTEEDDEEEEQNVFIRTYESIAWGDWDDMYFLIIVCAGSAAVVCIFLVICLCCCRCYSKRKRRNDLFKAASIKHTTTEMDTPSPTPKNRNNYYEQYQRQHSFSFVDKNESIHIHIENGEESQDISTNNRKEHTAESATALLKMFSGQIDNEYNVIVDEKKECSAGIPSELQSVYSYNDNKSMISGYTLGVPGNEDQWSYRGDRDDNTDLMQVQDLENPSVHTNNNNQDGISCTGNTTGESRMIIFTDPCDDVSFISDSILQSAEPKSNMKSANTLDAAAKRIEQQAGTSSYLAKTWTDKDFPVSPQQQEKKVEEDIELPSSTSFTRSKEIAEILNCSDTPTTEKQQQKESSFTIIQVVPDNDNVSNGESCSVFMDTDDEAAMYDSEVNHVPVAVVEDDDKSNAGKIENNEAASAGNVENEAAGNNISDDLPVTLPVSDAPTAAHSAKQQSVASSQPNGNNNNTSLDESQNKKVSLDESGQRNNSFVSSPKKSNPSFVLRSDMFKQNNPEGRAKTIPLAAYGVGSSRISKASQKVLGGGFNSNRFNNDIPDDVSLGNYAASLGDSSIHESESDIQSISSKDLSLFGYGSPVPARPIPGIDALLGNNNQDDENEGNSNAEPTVLEIS